MNSRWMHKLWINNYILFIYKIWSLLVTKDFFIKINKECTPTIYYIRVVVVVYYIKYMNEWNSWVSKSKERQFVLMKKLQRWNMQEILILGLVHINDSIRNFSSPLTGCYDYYVWVESPRETVIITFKATRD